MNLKLCIFELHSYSMYKPYLFFLFLILLFSCKNVDTQAAIVKIHSIKSPASKNCAQPFLFSNNEKLLMSWTHRLNDSVYSLQFSELIANEWSHKKEIIKGTNWFVNWADFPAIAENNGNILSHYLPKSDKGTYTYDIYLKLFNKKENKWKSEFILHDDNTKSEHGFVTLLPYKKDSFFVTWLDGRNTSSSHAHHGKEGMTIRAAEISNTGKKSNEVALDAKTCDCCQTSAAITEKGPIVVYRDRSDKEIRDISIIRFVANNWTESQPIFNDNWKISGCPVNGPKVSAYKNNLVVVWYTAANELPMVKLIFSTDNGITFNKPIIIDKVETIGRVDVAMINDKSALVSWVTSENSKTVIKAVKVTTNGNIGKSFIISEFDPSRSSGFPQLEILNDKAYFAWTDVSSNKPKIKTVFVELDNLKF